MKYTFTLLLSLCAFFAQAQIEVKTTPKKKKIGEARSFGHFTAEFYYSVSDDDTLYTIMFSDEQYRQIIDYKTFSFENIDSAVDKFYNAIKTVFDDANRKNKDYKLSIKLGDNDITIANYTVMGITSAMIFAKGGYFSLTKKLLDRLFDK